MGKAYWIIENIVKESSYIELAEAVERNGYDLLKLNGDFAFSMLDHLVEEPRPVIFSGCIEMSKMIGKYLSPKCGRVTFATFDRYLCSNYYPAFKEYLFNDNNYFLTLGELNESKWEAYATLGKEAMIFIRPDDGDKPFQAQLVDLQDFDRFIEYQSHLTDSTVVVSNPKNIRGEWRFVVSDNKEIIAVSCYRYQGLSTRIPSAPKGATELVRKLLEVDYKPDPVFCLDVCEDNDGNFWLMELTSFSSAGLYACNKDNIVNKVSKIVENNYGPVV